MGIEREERVALFAGSFDPFTLGHAALVESALRLFDRVVVGIGHNISKRALLPEMQRQRLIEELYEGNPRVRVAIYDGLTCEFARSVGASVLVRGLRSAADVEIERTLEAVNRELYPDIQSVLLFTPANLSHISSSCVRELLAFGQSVDSLMPQGVDIDKYLEK